jgi:RNA polymerase sigma factor (sigma-70 family)
MLESSMTLDVEAQPQPDADGRARFEALILPHLDAAFNLTRWLTHNDHDASDVVQEAFASAMRWFHGLRGEQAGPWLLAIVRNTAYAWLGKNRNAQMEPCDSEIHDDADRPGDRTVRSSEAELSRLQNPQAVNDALALLPIEMREALVLRELHDLSYKEIAMVQGIAVDMVTSRLSHGRQLLLRHLQQLGPGPERELH